MWDASLSRAGTSDRVLLLSGSLHAVLTAIFLILEKISRDVSAGAGANGAKRGVPVKKPEDAVRGGGWVPLSGVEARVLGATLQYVHNA